MKKSLNVSDFKLAYTPDSNLSFSTQVDGSGKKGLRGPPSSINSNLENKGARCSLKTRQYGNTFIPELMMIFGRQSSPTKS